MLLDPRLALSSFLDSRRSDFVHNLTVVPLFMPVSLSVAVGAFLTMAPQCETTTTILIYLYASRTSVEDSVCNSHISQKPLLKNPELISYFQQRQSASARLSQHFQPYQYPFE